MVCELVDNAFDANAQAVRLSWPGDKVFVIEDDGHGVKNLEQMLTLGGNRERDVGNLGYFGVGAKQALIWMWGVSEITSVCGQSRSSVKADWEQIARGLAPYPSQATIQLEHGDFGPSGTRLRCRSDRKYYDIPGLAASLGATYTPGLEQGKRLLVMSTGELIPVPCRKWPKVTECIDDVVNVADRKIRIRMGIVADGENNPYSNGFSFEYSYRVIKETWLGSNGHNTSRIAARITLLGNDWLLSTNKDDFAEYKDEIAEAITNRCDGLLTKASQASMTWEDDQFNRELADMVRGGNNREKRPNEGFNSGTVEPKYSGRKRRNASVVSDENGSVDAAVSRRIKSGFKVVHYDGKPWLGFGKYDSDANVLCLNTHHPLVAEKYRERDQTVLTLIIYGILCDNEIRRDGTTRPLLKTQIAEDFCSNWGANVLRVMERNLV